MGYATEDAGLILPTASATTSARRRIAGNLSLLTIAEAIARGVALITSVVAARQLGPAKLGEVALAMTLSFFFSAVADGGLTLLTYRRIVTDPARVSRLVVDTTMVQVGLSIVMMGALVGVAFAAPFGSGKRELLIVFAPYVLTQALSVLYALQALERMGSVALIKVITQLATAIPTVALVVATRDPIWVAIGLIFGQLVGDAITFAVLGRHNFRFTAPDLSAFIPLIKGGTALLSSLLLFNYLATIDIPILSAFRSSHQVGLYSAATRLVATAAIVSQVLITAVLPELVRRHMQGRERLRAFAEQLVALTSRVTLACTGMVIVESGAIVRLLYGAQYRPSSALLAILVPIVPLVWYGHLLGYVQVAAGRQRDFAVSLGVACAAATVAFPVTAGLWGSKGLAIALTATYLLQAAAFAFLLARHLDSSVIVAAVRQLPYALIPIIVLLIAHAVSRDSLLTAVPLWLAAVIAVEAAARWPTVAALGAIRPAQPG